MRTIIQFETETESDAPDMLRQIAEEIEDGTEYNIKGLKMAAGDGIDIDPRLTMAAANLLMAFDLPQPAEKAMQQMLYASMLHPGLTTGDIGLRDKTSMNSMTADSMVARAKELIAEYEASKS